MPLFHLSERALRRNDRILAAVYLPLIVLLVGGVILGVAGGVAVVVYRFLAG